ncbi:MAG: ankyrin repeat domain-containing protein [Pseudomonadota bacterium]
MGLGNGRRSLKQREPASALVLFALLTLVVSGPAVADVSWAVSKENSVSADSAPTPSKADLRVGDLYAVVVGISDYKDKSINRIGSASVDARDFAEFLQGQKKVFKEQHVKLLTDDKATKMEIDILLQSWLKEAKESDTIVIFLSGHGEPDLHSENAFYFLPWDVRPQHPAQTAVRMSGFLNLVNQYRAKRVLLIADSCHSGGFLSEMSGPQAKSHGSRTLALTRFIEEMEASAGVAALFSSKPDQTSWHLPPMRNSVFTHYLLKGLKGKADVNGDGIVTFYEAYQYAWRLTKERTNGTQEPYGRAPRIVGSFPIAVTEGQDIEGDLERLLLLAAKSGNLKMVMGLLEDRAYVNCRDDSTNDTPLILAARYGRINVVETLIKKGAKVNEANSEGNTAVMAAAENGHCATVDRLLNNEASVNKQNRNGEKALTLAARNGHTDVAERLMAAKANVKARNDLRSTPLILASRFGHTPMVKLLLQHGSDPNAVDKMHRSALSLAARFGHAEIVKLLLGHGARVEFEESDARASDSTADRHFLRTVLNGDAEKTRKLLKGGAVLKAATGAGDEPLTLAAGLGYADVVKVLLDSGADVNKAAGYKSTPLKWAAMNGFTDTVRLLLDRGARVNVRDKGGATPLIYASQNGHREIVGLLVGRDADIHARSNSGNTALILAAEYGHTKTVADLLKLGAYVNAASDSGTTALMLAAKNGHSKTVEILLSRGAGVHARDQEGRNALMWASAAGHAGIAAKLLAKRAKVDVPDQDGATALILAVKNNHTEVAKLLLGARATAVAEDREGLTARDLAQSAGPDMAKLFGGPAGVGENSALRR